MSDTNINDINQTGAGSVAVNTGTVNNTFIIQKDKEIPPDLVNEMVNPGFVIGRDADLKRIEQALQGLEQVVLVNGLGGIGKTTLAAKYYADNQEKYQHRAWIRKIPEKGLDTCFAGIPELSENLGLSFPDEAQDLYKYSIITNELKKLKGKNLLVIDNLNETVEDSILKKLPGKPNWDVLITSRNTMEDSSTIHLDTLSVEDSIQLFEKYYKKPVNKNSLEQLLKYIGYHTLTIELLAKTMDKNPRLKTVEELYSYLKEHQLDTKQLAINLKVKHSDQVVQVYSHLLKTFEISNLNENQKWILQQFSVLPYKDIDFDILENLLQIQEEDTDFINDLNDLVNYGWLEQKEGSEYKCHPIVQEVMLYQLKPDYESCKNLIDSINTLLHWDKSEHLSEEQRYFLEYGEKILDSISENRIEMDSLSYRIAYIYDAIGKSQEAVKYYKKAIEIREPIYQKSPDLLVISRGLGVNYFNYGTLLIEREPKKGTEFIQKAYELAKATNYLEIENACKNFLGVK